MKTISFIRKGTLLAAGLVLGAVMTLGASTAHADDRDDTIIIFTPGLMTTTTTGVVITVTDTISSTTSSTSEALFGDCEHAALYLEHNATALEQEIALGGGESVGDLAKMAGIAPKDEAAFAKLLRSQRRALTPLLTAETIDGEVAAQFSAIVADAMRQDEQLARYVQG